ncbi:MAG: 2-polyprenylphenol 6-hydroxylase [Pseudomonadota bacterium]|nr:2-polyprenylphenol 6-hydroxylase [Pseudomonadota bacterium]
MVKTIKNIFRILRIFIILARFDSLTTFKDSFFVKFLSKIILITSLQNHKIANKRPGERLALALISMGPSFIKLGQALSTRPDIIGNNISKDLIKLQDKLPPFCFKDVTKILEEDLEGGIKKNFKEIDPEPVAAASIAQVHFAITTENTPVAVKILRPEIRDDFKKDIELFHWLARVIEKNYPELRRLKPIEAIESFEKTSQLEMDLSLEAAAADELRENHLNEKKFKIPQVDWQRTSSRVLTLEKVGGVNINDIESLKENNLNPKDIVKNAAEVFFKMVFEHGFFHADMHPGNLFIDKKGTLIVVDFGIMGRLDNKTRRFLGEILLGFISRNYRRVAEVHIEAGYVPDKQDVDSFAQACRSITEPILGKTLEKISIANLLEQLFRVSATFEMEMQPQLLLLQKSMLLVEGAGRMLAPNVNMWELARPLIEEWILNELRPDKRIQKKLIEVRNTLERLPELMDNVEILAKNINKKT